MAGSARAQVAEPSAQPAQLEVRIGLSPEASKSLGELRVRRLADIELGDDVIVATTTSGPLGDNVAYVWMAEPAPGRLVIEVRVGGRPLSRRELNLTGLSGDVAARFAIVAAVEMIHAQIAASARAKRPPPPPRPSAAELEHAARGLPTIAGHLTADFTALPTSHGAVAGPAFAVGFRYRGFEEALVGRFQVGSTDAGATRLIEGGVLVDYRVWLGPSWRLAFGAEATGAAVHLGHASAVDAIAGETDSWTARAGGVLGVEARVARGAWIDLRLHPGALLRPVPFTTVTIPASSLQGAAVGVSLGLTLETAPAAPTSP